MIGGALRGIALLWRTCRDAVLVLLFASLLATLLGQIVGDRWEMLSGLMYMPALLVAPVALVADLLRRGRTLRGPRFLLSAIAVLSLIIELPHQVGLHFYDKSDPSRPTIRLVQWNVMWGGDWNKGARWTTTEQSVVDQRPDVVVLSEAPWYDEDDGDKTEKLCRALGPDWHFAKHDYITNFGYYSQMRVLSRYPVKKEYQRSIVPASIAVVRVEAPTPFRILLVDGLSGPTNKNPMLSLIAGTLRTDGKIDVVCGDFNAISRSGGFSAIRDMGYRDAAEHGLSWRGSWPSVLPIYDIDHVLAAPTMNITGTHTFGNDCTDHRGRTVELQQR